MVVRTWRKISAPGRLGHNSKHSPSNAGQLADKGSSVSPSYDNGGRSQASRRAVARKLFDSQTSHQRNVSFDNTQDKTTGELAIKCLLLEFSSYAHCKIEKALKTVKSVDFLLFGSSILFSVMKSSDKSIERFCCIEVMK